MTDQEISFDDAEAYERFMGRWSRLAAEVFLDWLDARPEFRWIDVGCGNGAFTEALFERIRPSGVEGVDPSPGQLAFARDRLRGCKANFQTGSATALPFSDASFDAAVMALVIFFVPEPEKGVAEMVRVTRPGGLVCAYAWDIADGGFPQTPMTDALRTFGVEPMRPPRSDVSTMAALGGLWRAAGLETIKTHAIEVERVFDDFEDWWSSCLGAAPIAAAVDRLSGPDRIRLKDMLRSRLPAGPDGRVRTGARANAISGLRPANDEGSAF